MKNKQRIFAKALSQLEEKEYSCNSLGSAIAPNDCDDPERKAAVEKYRTMYGFGGEAGYTGDGMDSFLLAVTDRKEKDTFGLRILLLSFAYEAWSDVD